MENNNKPFGERTLSEAEPAYAALTDRQCSIKADLEAMRASAVAGDLASRWNSMVQDNRYLVGQVERLERDLSDLKETVELLSQILLNDA